MASEFLSSLNKAYVENRIWGSDIYTSDSDMVCVLQHSGIYNINDYTPTEIDNESDNQITISNDNQNDIIDSSIESKKGLLTVVKPHYIYLKLDK